MTDHPVGDGSTPPEPRSDEAPDETIVAPRPRAGAPAPASESAPTPAPASEHSASASHRGATNPAPPVEEPETGQLPPDVVARMFKSPLDAKLRVPDAPTPPPEHTLPRRGVSPGIPVLSPVRSLSEPEADRGGALSERFGPPPPAVQPPPPAPRDGLRSTARANRRFGIGVVAGFAASIVVAGLGLWGVAILAFG